MSSSDATTLENLKLARDYVLARVTAGEDVVSYRIGDRAVTRRSGSEDLMELESLIEKYQKKVNAASSSRHGRNLANFNNAP